VFVGSSSEGLEFARAVRNSLGREAEVTIWNEGHFELGQTFIEGLTKALSHFDFAVLVLTPDDLVGSRTSEAFGPRDNVIFEPGLFMGGLGRDRTFILHQANPPPKIPSDLSGLTTAPYDWPRSDHNFLAAVAPACDRIRAAIRSLGRLDRASQAAGGLDLTRVKEKKFVMWTTVGGCEIRVTHGRVEEYPFDCSTAVVLPCNEYFDDRCAFDAKSSLGAYVTKFFNGQVDAFVSLRRMNAKEAQGPG